MSNLSMDEWRAGMGLAPHETVTLLGEWWMVRNNGEGVPTHMFWAGGRERYEEAVRIANERWGMCPVEIPLNAFFPAPIEDEATG